MGWTGSPYGGKDRKQFLLNEFFEESDTHEWYLTDLSMRGSTAYCISWCLDKKTGKLRHEGCVILTGKRKDEPNWIYYKEMGETVLPYYFDAPIGLIKKLNELGEPFNDNARQWRERCLENSVKKKFKIVEGAIVKFANSMKFNFPTGWEEEDTFTFTNLNGKKLFKTQTGKLCRITNWQKRDYQILGVQNV